MVKMRESHALAIDIAASPDITKQSTRSRLRPNTTSHGQGKQAANAAVMTSRGKQPRRLPVPRHDERGDERDDEGR